MINCRRDGRSKYAIRTNSLAYLSEIRYPIVWRYKYPKNILPKISGPTDVSRSSDSDDLVTKSSQTIE